MLTKDEEVAINKILDACKILNWYLATEKVTKGNENEEITGLVIGTKEYILKILKNNSISLKT